MEFVLCTQGVMWKEKPKPGVEWGVRRGRDQDPDYL